MATFRQDLYYIGIVGHTFTCDISQHLVMKSFHCSILTCARNDLINIKTNSLKRIYASHFLIINVK